MIYLDNNATTQPSDHVIHAMLPYLRQCYFNASAPTAELMGADIPRREACKTIAKLLNAEEPNCFAFTSGATESNNWVFYSLSHSRKAGRIIISAIEHASISEPAATLAEYGFQISEIPVDAQGMIRSDALVGQLSAETLLVSIMAANNETGVLEPISAIGQLVRKHSPTAIFHVDATQAVGKIPIDLQTDWPEVDLVSFSAHKFHGPKGIGGLYLRPGISLSPMMRGGSQESGLRSGTTNTAALAGLAAAAEDANPQATMSRIAGLRDRFEVDLAKVCPDAVFHSRNVPRLPNTSCFSLPGLGGDDIAHSLAAVGILVGTGAACSSGSSKPPKTLISMGVNYDLARSSVRISLSESTTQEELSACIAEICKFHKLQK